MLSLCGIDVSKDRLDVIVLPEEQRSSVSNNRAGWADLVERLRGQIDQRSRCDKMTVAHSITSSARASTDAGTSSPSAFAVLRLITSSYLTGSCTGRPAGFSPLRMRSTYEAERR